jgi:hypothetical protein
MSRKDCYPINQFLPTDVVSSNPTQVEVSCDKVCQEFAVRLFFPGTPVSPTNKTGIHDITEMLLEVAANTIEPNQTSLPPEYTVAHILWYNLTFSLLSPFQF